MKNAILRDEMLNELNEKMDRLRTLELNKIAREPKFLNIESYEVTLANNEKFIREKLVKSNTRGDAVILYTMLNDDEVLITIEPRVFTKQTVTVGLTAGYIEPGEEPIDAARRELLEETGYVADELICLGGFYQDVGVSAAYNKSFLARGLKKVAEPTRDKDEYIENMVIKKDELDVLADLGFVVDASALLTIEKANKYIEKENEKCLILKKKQKK